MKLNFQLIQQFLRESFSQSPILKEMVWKMHDLLNSQRKPVKLLIMLPILLMMACPYYQSYLQPKISIISKVYPFMGNSHRTKEWHCFQGRLMVNIPCCAE